MNGFEFQSVASIRDIKASFPESVTHINDKIIKTKSRLCWFYFGDIYQWGYAFLYLFKLFNGTGVIKLLF